MTLLVVPPVTLPWIYAVAFRRDSVLTILTLDKLPDVLGTIGFISQDTAFCEVNIGQKVNGNLAVMDITAGKNQLYGIS